MFPRATTQPFSPDAWDIMAKRRQRRVVARDAVVRVMASHFLAQRAMLLRNRSVPMLAAPDGDRPERPAKTGLGGFAFHHPVPTTGTTPVVREAQQVERPRRCRVGVSLGSDPRGPDKRHQPSLLWMQGQAV